jgi:hypothetical protein
VFENKINGFELFKYPLSVFWVEKEILAEKMLQSKTVFMSKSMLGL